MKTIVFKNFHLLDGTENMEDHVVEALEVKNGFINRIGQFEIEPKSQIIDLNGKYIIPGLINLHSHLPSTGKPGKSKLGDLSKLVNFLMSNPITRAVALGIEKKSALQALNNGVTTIRTVGGIGDLDAKLRDKINSGKILGPRLLVANNAIGTPGGHMVGTVASAVSNEKEAVEAVQRLIKEDVNLIKLMITGGVLDGKELGKPAPLRMSPEIVKACCDEAHKHGLLVAAHVESKEGIKVAVENGVDSIEHGGELDENLVKIMKERNAAVVMTLSPAIPLAELPADKTPYGELGKINTTIVLDGIIKCAKTCLENDIPLGLGTDAGSSLVSHYNFWRELQFFVNRCGVTPKFALYSATLLNAKIAHIEEETGSIQRDKWADLVVLNGNPLENKFESLRDPAMVMIKGRLIKKPKVKKIEIVDHIVERFM